MRIYQYRPLSDDDFTRILILHPSTSYSAPLRCDLIHCQEKDFHCDALSYAWGPPQFTKRLFCPKDKSHIAITPSLDSALRHLRHQSDARRLWVDAVCINQQDGPEKSRQIRSMTMFYSEARQVIAWVGDGYGSGAQVLEFFQEHKRIFGELEELARGEGYYEPDEKDPVSTQAIIDLERNLTFTFGQTRLEILMEFFRRPWFQRRWIIQEIVMAEKAMIQCGTVLMDFGSFALAAMVINGLCGLWAGEPLDPTSLMHSDISCTIGAIAREQRSKSWNGLVCRGSRFPIYRLLNSFRSAKCFDDRDRIYGLLGISDDLMPAPAAGSERRGDTRTLERAEIVINYEQSVAEVYTNLALALLGTRTYSLYRISELLRIAGAFRPVDNNAAELPTWIPDWRAERRYIPLSGSFNAGQCSEIDDPWSMSKDNKILRIRGWRHAIVAKKLRNPAEISSFEELRELVLRWWIYYRTVHPAEDLRPDELAQHPACEWYRFFDFVTTNRLLWDGNGVQPPDEFIRILFDAQMEKAITETRIVESSALVQRQTNNPVSGRMSTPAEQQARIQVAAAQMRLRSSVTQMIELVEGRCLCINSNGGLMNCPSDAKTGDVVAVFTEIDTPFVIRPVSVRSGIRGREKMYRIIGDCYVEGIMEGELDTKRTHPREKPCDFLLV